MSTYETIVAYLMETYHPDAMIVYGSFADGSANEHSDFDALLMADSEKTHDSAVMDGIVLDVLSTRPRYFKANTTRQTLSRYMMATSCWIKAGWQGIERPGACIYQNTTKTGMRYCSNCSGAKKMLARTSAGDAEGYYRWPPLLVYQNLYGCQKAAVLSRL